MTNCASRTKGPGRHGRFKQGSELGFFFFFFFLSTLKTLRKQITATLEESLRRRNRFDLDDKSEGGQDKKVMDDDG